MEKRLCSTNALHFTFVGVVATLADSVVVAEFAGYWLHRILHGGKFPSHSWGHLMRHFLLHGARQPICAGAYYGATDSRANLGNVGIPRLSPPAITLYFCGAAMALLAVPPVYQALALYTLLGWPVPMFSYWYDQMPKQNFWMTLKTQKTARPASPECAQ